MARFSRMWFVKPCGGCGGWINIVLGRRNMRGRLTSRLARLAVNLLCSDTSSASDLDRLRPAEGPSR